MCTRLLLDRRKEVAEVNSFSSSDDGSSADLKF